MPTPIATHAQMFIPVNGRAPEWPPEEGAELEPAVVEVPLAAVAVGCDAEEPLLDADEAPVLEPELEFELEPEPEPDEPLGCDVVLLPVSGSTYC